MKSKVTLVIADADERVSRRLAEFLGRQEDVDVIRVCKSGYATLNAVRELRPDVVLLDLILPGRDGIAVLEDFRHMQSPPGVIVTSALDNSRMINYACALGADFYLCKPYELETAYRRIIQVGQRQSYSLSGELSEDRRKTADGALRHDSRYTLEARITETIRALGIPAHIKGYQYIREGIILALQDENMLGYITKYLYPTIAKKYNTTSSSVERAIRHAIGVAWERGGSEAMAHLYGENYRDCRSRPTNSEFLSLLVDKFQLEKVDEKKKYGEVAQAM